jgi:hypothetical protein
MDCWSVGAAGVEGAHPAANAAGTEFEELVWTPEAITTDVLTMVIAVASLGRALGNGNPGYGGAGGNPEVRLNDCVSASPL